MGGLLERGRELALLEGAAAAAAAGDGRAVAVVGPPGIGKTALLDAALGRASSQHVQVLVARAGEFEGDVPYGVVRQLLAPVLRSLPASRLRTVLADPAGRAWSAIERASSSAPSDSAAVVHGLYWLLAELCGERPVLVAIDDVQWADAASVRFASYLIRRLGGLAASVLLTVRTGEPDPEPPTMLPRLLADPVVDTVPLPPLSKDAVADVVAERLGSRPDDLIAAACRRSTGGVPFLVHALAGELAASGVAPDVDTVERIGQIGPDSVGQATMLRLTRIHPAATGLARAVAVLGPDASLPTAARLADVTPEAAAEARDALVVGQVLSAEPLAFRHPILRSAIYRQIPAGERSDLHLRAAEQLAEAGLPDDIVASHLLVTEPRGHKDIIDRLRRAAAAAQARGAPENAPTYLRRALDEMPPRALRAQLLLELGLAEKLVRDPVAASHLQSALDLLEEPNARARAALELSDVLTFAGQWDAALAAVDLGLAEVDRVDPDLALGLQTMRVNTALFDSATAVQVDVHLPALRTAALADGGSRPALLEVGLADVLRGEHIEEAAGLVDRGLDDGRLLAEAGSGSWEVTRAAIALAFADRLTQLEALLDAMAEDARRRGSVWGFVASSGFRVCLHARRGELAHCEDELRRTVSLAQEHELPMPMAFTLYYALEALVERPELDDLAELARNLQLPPVHNRTLTGPWLVQLRARLSPPSAAARAEAIERLRAAGEVMTALKMHPGVCPWRSTLALTLPADDRDEALSLGYGELAEAQRVGLPRPIGVALLALGRIETGTAGLDRLREAVTILDRADTRLEHARALVALGGGLRRGNQRAAARDPLRQGLDLAVRCGATRLVEHARTELVACGARPRRLLLTGRDALTPSERRVAAMAADGMRNAEIAQALFVTAKTVENQLGRVYQKLGIAGRAELGEALEN